MTATDLVLPGTGYMQQPGDRLPWVRFVVLAPCSRIGSDADAQQLWLKFQQFLLKKQPVTSLTNGLTRSAPGLVWTRWATNWASVIDALLTSAEEDEAVAAARLELPDEMPRFGRDQRCALLILHFEPPRKDGTPMPPAGPVSWTDHMLRALQLPRAFVSFLSGELGLTTPGEPSVVLGFRLEAQHDLAEMIDISGLQQLPGGRHRSQAIGYFVGDPEGQPAEDAVERMITDILRYGLSAERGPYVASPAGQRPEPRRADAG